MKKNLLLTCCLGFCALSMMGNAWSFSQAHETDEWKSCWMSKEEYRELVDSIADNYAVGKINSLIQRDSVWVTSEKIDSIHSFCGKIKAMLDHVEQERREGKRPDA